MEREQSRGMRYWIRQSLYRLVCGIATTAAVVSAGQAQDPAKGGTLVIARPADIFTFDPYNTQDDRSIFTELTLYERLVRLSADGKGVDPELATEWTIAHDGLSADFKLRKGVMFSDGTPVDGR